SLDETNHPEKIKLLGWFLHVHKRKTHFQPADIGDCYDKLNIERPSGFGGYFTNLLKPGRGLLQGSSRYTFENKGRAGFDQLYGSREITVQVTELLLTLPAKIPDLAERTYLDEALICFKHNAFRAAMVMTWNLAYHHLCDYVLKNRLSDFNSRWQVVFQ